MNASSSPPAVATANAADTPLMEVRHATVAFGGVRAVNEASLNVARGALLGLIGPNGSGKSTLLAAVSRLTDLTSGQLLVNGEDYTRAPRHIANVKGIARTFQTVRLISTMTVVENVMVGASTATVQASAIASWLLITRSRTRERQARAAAEHALERVGMADSRHSRPQDLPYGPQRKVEIARALASEPKLLLLDEPTAGMSHAEREEVGDLLVELNANGLTEVMVEHDLAMIHRVCGCAIALNFGSVIAEGSTRTVADNPQVREAYLGHDAVGAQARAAEQPEPT